MTKEKEMTILFNAAKQLGADSYCGIWLNSMLMPLQECMKSDMMPEVYFSEDRYRQDALASQKNLIMLAERNAERIITLAEDRAKTIIKDAEDAARKERENLEELRRRIVGGALIMQRQLEGILNS